MGEPARKLATYEDLSRLPEKVHAEILDGDVYLLEGPLPRHEWAVDGLVLDVAGPFHRGRGGPGGWWILTSVDVELERHDVVRPDLSGWRRERVPAFPEERPIRIRPDWICEVLSPSNARYDLVKKANLYLRSGVPHYWVVDPAARVLQAFELEGDAWLRLGAWEDGDVARIRPFAEVEIDVGRLFPPPAEGELVGPMTVSEALATYGATSL